MTMNRDHISKLKTGKWQVDYRGNVPPVLDPRPTKAADGVVCDATMKSRQLDQLTEANIQALDLPFEVNE